MARKTKEQLIREQIAAEQRETAERNIEYWFSELCKSVNTGNNTRAGRVMDKLFGAITILSNLHIITLNEYDSIDSAAWAVYESRGI